MGKYIEEMNALVISLENSLESNLYLLTEALNHTMYQLIIEITGKAINRNYDTVLSYLLIFYNYINFVKRDDPFFEAIIRLPDILNYESTLNHIQYQTIYVSEKLKDHIGNKENVQVLKESSEDEVIVNEIKRYLIEDVHEQIEIIQGKREGKNKDLQIQSLKRVVLGGTFDHLHYGHKIMLSSALLLAIPSDTQVYLGLTGPALLKNKKNKELLQTFEARKERIEYFQNLFTPNTKFFIFELLEPMGPLKDQEFDGLVISHETLQSSLGINKFRKENGLSELQFYIVDIISQSKSQCGNDFTEKASSTSIRNYLLSKNNLTSEQFGYLFEKWKSIFTEYDKNAVFLNKWFDNIKVKYSEKFRYYHTLSHVYAMLQLSEQYEIHHKAEVQLAIWFHDVIYNPKRKDNEQRSADYYLDFDTELKQNGIGNVASAQVVEAFIIQTAHHTNDDLISEIIKKDEKLKEDLNLFLDIDLSILGSKKEDYDLYSQGIIKEYSHFTPEQIKTGRTQILQTFLKQDHLFKTKAFQERFAQQTKFNITSEITQLQDL